MKYFSHWNATLQKRKEGLNLSTWESFKKVGFKVAAANIRLGT